MNADPHLRLTVLGRTIDTLLRAPREEDRVKIIFDAFEKLGLRDGYRFRVALLDESSKFLRFVYACPNDSPFDVREIQIGVENSITGAALSTKTTLVIDDILDRNPRHVLFKINPRSLAVFPLIRNGAVFGSLSIDSDESNSFAQDSLDILTPFANLLASAIELSSQRLKDPDVVSTVSRFRKRQVLVLGKDNGEELQRLKEITACLREMNYEPLLVKEHPDIPELSNEEKVRVFADHSRFVVLENSFPAGQIAELKMCATNRIITAAVREAGRGSSYMVTDYFNDFHFIKEFEYQPIENQLNIALRLAVDWAEVEIKNRICYYNTLYPWRSDNSPSIG